MLQKIYLQTSSGQISRLPHPVEINGLPFTMILNFYEGKGMTHIGYTAMEEVWDNIIM